MNTNKIDTVSLLNADFPLNTWGRMTLLIKFLKNEGFLPSETMISCAELPDGTESYVVLGVSLGVDEIHIHNTILRMAEGWRKNGFIPQIEDVVNL